MRESELLRACMTWARYQPWIHCLDSGEPPQEPRSDRFVSILRYNAGTQIVSTADSRRAIRVGVAGMPDILMIRNDGLLGAIELKTEKGKVSARQLAMHVWLKKTGVHVAICRSVADFGREARVFVDSR
ncbi:MAG: VRR-NUC domain-containing protein [Deltaproteobacteria bacterium]|nr:VRR-NUC domain-containing protein [Deltaproteobacteria bacterium]